MARPVRLEFGGALYHVTARGDRREAIYEDDADREHFLEVLGAVVGQFNWCCHAYCLMSNHYHLVIATPDGNLSKGMRQLNGGVQAEITASVPMTIKEAAADQIGELRRGFKSMVDELRATKDELSRLGSLIAA